MTRRLTMAQAIIQFLKAQSVARDGKEQTFFGGCLGFLVTAMWPASDRRCSRILISPTTCFAMSRAWFTPQRVLPK